MNQRSDCQGVVTPLIPSVIALVTVTMKSRVKRRLRQGSVVFSDWVVKW